jgi:hypothetical protein
MQGMLTSRRIMVVGGAALLLGGCGLMDALDKLKNITFKLPEQMYSVSTDNPNWRSPPAGGIPPLPCGQGQPIANCCAAPIDCTRSPLVCEAERCSLKFTYEQVTEVKLGEVEALKQNSGMIFSDLLLKQIDLTVDNKMNVTTPPVDLYVAPTSTKTHTGMGAQKIATIPSQIAGFKGQVVVPLDGPGQQAFSSFARAVQTPFNLIMSTDILVKSGDQVPMGKIDFVVSGTVEAKL